MSFQRITISGSIRSSWKSDGDRVADDPVAVVLELLQLDERLLHALQPLQPPSASASRSTAPTRIRHWSIDCFVGCSIP